MRLCIRTLLLTVALLSSLTSTASACCLLDPFHWLFGCGCYPACGYGPPQGYSPGYGGYQPAYPGVMSPCGPCAPACPIAPLVSVFRMPPCLPMPAIFRQCLDPCGMGQYGGPMMPAPMVQYQPAPMPMMPQQYFAPQMMQAPAMDMGCDGGCGAGGPSLMSGMQPGMMQQPMMSDPMLQSHAMQSSDDCCGDEGMMGYGGMPGMMPGYAPAAAWSAGTPLMAWSPQGVYPGGGFPNRAVHSSLPPSGYGFFNRPRVIRRETRRANFHYRRMMHHAERLPAGYQNGGMMPYGYGQPMQPMYPQMGYQQGYSLPQQMPAPHMSMQTMPQQWSAPHMSMQTMPQQWPAPHMSMQPMPQQWSAPQASMIPGALSGMHSTMPAPMPGSQMVSPMTAQMMSADSSMAGDIMGDHEGPTSRAALVPVAPNSYNGVTPFLRASLTRPLLSTSTQYHKSVR